MMVSLKNIAAVGVIALAAVGMSSCKGRHADATPNGETVDVVIEESVQAPAPGDSIAPAPGIVADTMTPEITQE